MGVQKEKCRQIRIVWDDGRECIYPRMKDAEQASGVDHKKISKLILYEATHKGMRFYDVND